MATTNPGNTVRVRARTKGRASVYEANGWAQGWSSGLFSGNGVLQNTSADMNVLVGGTTTNPDTVIAQNPAGYKIALDLVSQQVIRITAPASNSRIACVVAYTDDLALDSTDTNTTGSPSSCGLIVVYGATSANPDVPDDSTIRTAITSDGATGSQAIYGIIAQITVASTTTTITDTLILNKTVGLVGEKVKSGNIAFETFAVQDANGWIEYYDRWDKEVSLSATGDLAANASVSVKSIAGDFPEKYTGTTTYNNAKIFMNARGNSTDQNYSTRIIYKLMGSTITAVNTRNDSSSAYASYARITIYKDQNKLGFY